MNLLLKLLPQTLKHKLQLALFTIGFLPYLFILIYSYNLGEKKILDDTIAIQYTQMNQVQKNIETQLFSLEKELHFLASLEIMNDMTVGDVDKRISRLLIQKQRDLALDIHLFTIDANDRIIASSDMKQQHVFKYSKAFKNALRQNRASFFTNTHLVMFAPIHSTLQEDNRLNYLFMEYALSNLQSFTIYQKGIRSMLYLSDRKTTIGYLYDNEELHIKEGHSHYLSDKYLVIYKEFRGILSKWNLVYMIKKSVALDFLDGFIIFVWILFILGFIIIAIISLWITKRILEPIAQLSKATQSIIATQDYSTQVSVSSQGEIADLANDFNVMVRETNHAFSVLEEESRLRLLRFVQLINIFNRLIQTQTEKSCITLALSELQTLMPHQHFGYSTHYPKRNEAHHSSRYMILYVTNFEKQTSDFYGVISFDRNTPIHDPNEEKFYRSIATMIMLQLDQIRLIEQTKAVSRAKSTFISHMSHELRTPLHTILSSAQYLIGYGNITHEQQDTIATMESSAQHLLGIINGILDLVQIEAGKVSTTPVKLKSDEIELLIEEVISMLGLLVEQKEIDITFHNTLSDAIDVTIDRRFFKQILINLLSNAIKFTEHGSIDFRMEKCADALCIIVEDSGIGISQEDLHLLFDDFTQVRNMGSNQQKGSGLGLAISRKLAQLFNAQLRLESEGIGKGTKAILTLRN